MGGTYEADLYDIVTSGTFRGDIEWYRRLARESGGPVLELGAGTGRVTIPIAEDGVEVTALDVDRGMLDRLHRKIANLPAGVRGRLVVREGDMRSFRLEQQFALVIIPFRAFLHNLTEDDQLACLRAVFAHVKPGGRLALNVFHPSLEFMAQHAAALAGVWRWRDSHPLDDGGSVVRSEATRYDTVRRLVHSQHRYEQYATDGTLTRTFLQPLELSYLYPQDIRQLLERAGFESIEIAGDFDGHPFANDTDELVVTAIRPSIR
jgi:SAM-dependent methyltransferase